MPLTSNGVAAEFGLSTASAWASGVPIENGKHVYH